MDYNKHYIRTNEYNDVVHGFSDAFETPAVDDILINERGGRHFELFGEINPALMDMDGNYLYAYNPITKTVSRKPIITQEV